MFREKKIIITLSLVLVILVGANFGLLWITKQKVDNATRVVLDLKNTTASAAKAHSLEGVVSQTAPDRQTLDTYFVQKEDSVKFIEQIENLGKLAGTSLTVAGVTVASSGKELRMDVETTGSFDDSFYFLTLLESLPYKIRLDQVDFLKKGDSLQTAPDAMAGINGGWGGKFTIVLESFMSPNTNAKQ